MNDIANSDLSVVERWGTFFFAIASGVLAGGSFVFSRIWHAGQTYELLHSDIEALKAWRERIEPEHTSIQTQLATLTARIEYLIRLNEQRLDTYRKPEL